MDAAELFRILGIPAGYGQNPPLPTYAEAARLEDVEPNIIGRMQRLAPPAAHGWRAMKTAAKEDGIEIMLVSGFRSYEYQIELIRRKLAAGGGIESILRVNAAPGFSQHHTGLAIDIATPGIRPLTEDFEHSEAFFWMQHHAERFGFNMPYGRDNRFGLAYEPWHWSQLP